MNKKHSSGFTLMEMLIVVAVIAILVAIAIPTFSSALEKSREATDLANVRAAYAEVMEAAIAEDTSSTLYDSSKKAYSKTVDLKQKQDGWSTSTPITIGGITSSSDGGSNTDGTWIGLPKADGTCDVSYSSEGKTILNWSGTSGSSGGNAGDSNDNGTCTVTIINNSNYTLEYNGTSYGPGYSFSFSVEKGSPVTITKAFVSTLSINNKTVSATMASNLDWNIANGDLINSDCSITASGSCILSGTTITLADGSTKLIDDVTTSDRLMTYNFYTGATDGNYPMYVLKHENKDSVVITLTLDNGTTLEMCDWQQFFDMDAREYFDIDSVNYSEAVGRNIMFLNQGNIETTQIIAVTAEERICTCYEIFTEYNKNFVANGILTVEPETWLQGVYSIKEDLTIDMDQYQSDAETYGLYTYEQFADLMTEEQFEQMNIADKKIAVGKGIVSEDWLFDLYREWMPIYDETLKN